MIPAHAKNFRGKAKNIPAEDVFMLPYQSAWIFDRAILKIMEKSRRIGVSYATAYGEVRRHAQKLYRLDSWVSSRDETDAKLFVKDCKAFARLLKTAAQDVGERIVDKETIHSIKFANGTEINSLASNPDVFAGKGGDVTLDEFALRSDPRGVYSIASPTIDWGGALCIISTHRGSANYFNELLNEIKNKNNPKRFSHHRITLQDALDQGFLWKLQCKLTDSDPRLQMTEADYFDYQKSRCADEETFLQEYMCQPSDDNAAFLGYDLLSTCTLRGADNLKITSEETRDFSGRKGKIRTLTGYSPEKLAAIGAPLYLGVDVGRDHDLTVLWLDAAIMGISMPAMIVEMETVEFERQEKELYALLNLPNMRRCCIDNTGIGKQFAERAQKKFGQYRVEACTFTAGLKEELAYPVRMAFEDRTTRIPDDDKIIADLRAVKKETTAAGNIRFASDRGKNGHSDRFWAKALAIHAKSATNTGAVWAESVPTSEIIGNDQFYERVPLEAF